MDVLLLQLSALGKWPAAQQKRAMGGLCGRGRCTRTLEAAPRRSNAATTSAMASPSLSSPKAANVWARRYLAFELRGSASRAASQASSARFNQALFLVSSLTSRAASLTKQVARLHCNE